MSEQHCTRTAVARARGQDRRQLPVQGCIGSGTPAMKTCHSIDDHGISMRVGCEEMGIRPMHGQWRRLPTGIQPTV